jgi:DNA-binding HxlR family transcriptional regulator
MARKLAHDEAGEGAAQHRGRRRRVPSLNRRGRCAIAGTLQIVGDQWTLVSIRDLLRGVTRFADLASAPEGITRSVLSERLKLLEAEGIVRRSFYSEHPPRAEYRLTTKGLALGPTLGALARWGTRYLDHDTAIVSSACGHELTVSFECPTCERKVPASEARIAEVTVRHSASVVPTTGDGAATMAAVAVPAENAARGEQG